MMEKDEKLQSLLGKYAMQETSADFDKTLMEKIASLSLTKAASKPLISNFLKRILVASFLIIVMIVLIIATFMQPGLIDKFFSVTLPVKIYKQLFTFLAVFWFVMFINILWNKKQTSVFFKRFNFLL